MKAGYRIEPLRPKIVPRNKDAVQISLAGLRGVA
jgi:hypothetical protein